MKFLATAFLSLAALSAGTIDRFFTVDTSSLAGMSGFLSLQFNPGFDADPAVASILGFAASGATLGAATPTGDVTGSLPMTVAIGNTAAFNELFQSIVFGTSFEFVLSLSGPAVDTPTGAITGSTFSLSLIDSALTSFLLSDDPSGAALIVDLFPDASIGMLRAPAVNYVPEPSTGLLALGAVAAFFVARRLHA
jgi:hypothetical protein